MRLDIDSYLLTKEQYGEFIEKHGGWSPYTLRYDEYRDSARRAAVATFIKSIPSEKPTSLMVAAPAGSGKTGLSAYVESKFIIASGEGIIKIDPDKMRVYHKNYGIISEEIPQNAYSETQKFMTTLLDDTIKPYATEKKFNISQEGTFASKDAYIEILKRQKENGYDIQLSTIVVHRFEQILSCFERQQYMFENGLELRINTLEYCDKTYNNFMETLKEVENQGLYSSIKVFRRGIKETEPILAWQTGDPRHRTAVEAVLAEREDSLKRIMNDKESYLQRMVDLRDRIEKNPESIVKQDQLKQVHLLMEQFNEQIKQQSDNSRE